MKERDPLDWTGAGYDAFPRTAPHPPRDEEWGLLDAAVCEAREGRFELIKRLPAAIAKSTDLVFHSVACEVVGDAGGAEELEALVRQLETAEFEEALDIAQALYERGRLVDVPAVFYFYEQHRMYENHRMRKDAQIALAWLSLWLCEGDDYFPDPGSGAFSTSWEEYRLIVGRRYFELWNRYGTNLVHIDRGVAFSVRVLAERMLANNDVHQRHKFEAHTGISCRRWFDADGSPKPLRMAADVERYLESGRADQLAPGQRAFMGYPLEDVGAAVIDNSLLVRTVFDMDEMFSLEYGYRWHHHGYFYTEGLPPPDALIPTDGHRPWQSLHTCLRAAKEGRREVLGHLSGLLGPERDSMFQLSAIELLVDAADDHVIAPWRKVIVENDNPEFIYDLCDGLLRRGLLRDIPLVLKVYAKYAEAPHFHYLPYQVSLLLDRPGPDSSLPATHEGPLVPPQEYCRRALARVAELRRVLPDDAVPMLRGQVFSVARVAELVIAGLGNDYDLRWRFEAATGIDCTSWYVPEKSPERAAAMAREFLSSGQADRYQPGRLYFFGHEVELRS